MRLSLIVSSLVLVAAAGDSGGSSHAQQPPAPPAAARGTRLEQVSWQVAEQQLKPETVVVVPLGAGASEHGPHLPLGTDQRLAEYVATRIVQDLNVVVAPTLAYHHVPGFTEYAGSTSLPLNTARDLTADVVRSLAHYGPRRFYVVTTSAAPLPALSAAAQALLREGILLRYTDPRARLEPIARQLRRQPIGGHADEIETSMMLFVEPSAVDMPRATREFGNETVPLTLTRRDGGRGTFSASGVWGDATAATRDKGAAFMNTLLGAVRADIEDLRRTTPPPATGSAPVSAPPQPATRRPGARADECLPGDDRAIRGIGPAFSSAWLNLDALRIGSFWSPEGDMIHPDGTIEPSAQTIRENRAALFARPEYAGSRHGLTIGQIRCLSSDIAIADARWDLRGVTDARGTALPPVDGLCTLVLKRRDGGWSIEAYRYSLKQPQRTQPTLLNRPGFIDR